MTDARGELLTLADYAWTRLQLRCDGLTDEEYGWEPAPAVATIAWRMTHVGEMLSDDRNATWLGLERPPDRPEREPVATAAEARASLEREYAWFRGCLTAVTENALWDPIGPIAAPYGDSTRVAFVLHQLDELIHHGAEIALLRDLYGHR